MIYFLAFTVLFSVIGFLYLKVNIISLILILSLVPFLIYANSRKSKELNSIFLNQIFAYILAVFMSLKWQEFNRLNLYIYLLSSSSYLRVLYVITKRKFLRFVFWLPVGYVVGDIFYLRFKNPYLFVLGFLIVILIGFRDLKT
ncbi:MAG: hypothetical protein PWQ20_1300, partial [Thermotogaceae bacterium]|nr:hypothetical protein [Thermotogaceae bacterium]